jgi:8-oxo-dGTP pyrophosphatase MutT (NUDIX family)
VAKTYEITDGIPESQLPAWLAEAAAQHGQLADGRINYTDAEIAPVVMCTVACGSEILLVKRGYGLADANGYWSTVNGFVDEAVGVAEIARREIAEELGVAVKAAAIAVGDSYTLRNPKEKRRYIVFPCLLALKTQPEIQLNEENTDFAWIRRPQVESYHILDDLPHAIDSALALNKA